MDSLTKKILIVDDNASILTMLNLALRDMYKVYLVNSGESALRFLEKLRPDIILMDVEMPGMSGYELIKTIKSLPDINDIPVIFLTALHDADNETNAFELGAVDYIHKPLNNAIVKARLKLHLELETYRKDLRSLVDAKTSQIQLMQDITLNLLAHVNEFRDSDTGNHVRRTVGYVCLIMDNLPKYAPESYQLTSSYYDDIKKSTPLHDIGKISISDSILLKQGPLTSYEYEIMKKHVISGATLLQNAIEEFRGPSFLDVALELVLTHHEKWDGSGYPYKLNGTRIPISGRIMAVADVYDALTSQRPYKEAYPHEKAMKMIMESSGKHFDPILVDTFYHVQDDILKVASEFKN